MKPEVKEMWVNALRSGEYTQSRFSLCSGTGFCCLGVLCDLYLKLSGEVGSEGWDSDGVTTYFLKKDFREDGKVVEKEDQYLPKCVREWAGIDDKNPSITIKDEVFLEGLPSDCSTRPLSFLNDNGWGFTEIAAQIEKLF